MDADTCQGCGAALPEGATGAVRVCARCQQEAAGDARDAARAAGIEPATWLPPPARVRGGRRAPAGHRPMLDLPMKLGLALLVFLAIGLVLELLRDHRHEAPPPPDLPPEARRTGVPAEAPPPLAEQPPPP